MGTLNVYYDDEGTTFGMDDICDAELTLMLSLMIVDLKGAFEIPIIRSLLGSNRSPTAILGSLSDLPYDPREMQSWKDGHIICEWVNPHLVYSSNLYEWQRLAVTRVLISLLDRGFQDILFDDILPLVTKMSPTRAKEIITEMLASHEQTCHPLEVLS